MIEGGGGGLHPAKHCHHLNHVFLWPPSVMNINSSVLYINYDFGFVIIRIKK